MIQYLKFSKIKKKNKITLFRKIIKILNQIQLIKDRSVKNFKNQKYVIPKYDKKILIRESNLFIDCKIFKKI